MGVTLTITKANPGFVLYDQLNKATSLSHQSHINKTQVAYHFCFYLSLQKTRHFQRTNLNLYLPKMLQSKKLTTKISRQTEFTMSRRLSAHNKHFMCMHTPGAVKYLRYLSAMCVTKVRFFGKKNWESCVTKSRFFSGPQTKKLMFVTLTKHCPFQHLRS